MHNTQRVISRAEARVAHPARTPEGPPDPLRAALRIGAAGGN